MEQLHPYIKGYQFDIIHEDGGVVVINKPPAILTHHTKISEDDYCVQDLLTEQLKIPVLPIHRLDRATTGILIFAKDSETAERINQVFREKKVEKTYWAIVRGYLEPTGMIDKPLFSETKNIYQEALSHWKVLGQCEMPWEVSRYPTARYSILELKPETGRHHQLRKHMAKLRHPIIGDRRHGDVKHNNFWRDKFQMNRMWLHAGKIEIPLGESTMKFEAQIPKDFLDMLATLGLESPQ